MTSPVQKVGLPVVLAALLASPAAVAGHLNVVLEADLSGRQEVGPGPDSRIAGDPNGRGEAYVFGIDGIGELDQAPGNGRMAHIHRGAPGQNGPVVVTLAWPQDGASADCIDESRILPNGAPAFARDPGTGALRATALEILTEPGEYYVNVHNAEYPSGVVRGQLRDALEP